MVECLENCNPENISKAFYFELGRWKDDNMIREQNYFRHSSLELQRKEFPSNDFGRLVEGPQRQ